MTTTEFLIVKELAKRPGVIKERAHLMDIAYKENTEIEDRTIDSHVKRIRKKFKKVDENFLQLKLDMEVGIDGMLANETKKSASILKKFLIINFTIFSVLGLFNIIYLEAIQPTLVKGRSDNHKIVINNTKENLERLNVKYTKEGIRDFLLSTRFLFQSLDRVQFYDLSGTLIGDTNILDLDQSVFTGSDIIFEETLGSETIIPEIEERLEEEQKDEIKDIITNKFNDEIITLINDEKNNFLVSTLSKIKFQNNDIGYIVVSEQANDIITAVKERKAFIIRTMIAVAIVILIFLSF